MAKKNRSINVGGKATHSRSLPEAFRFGRTNDVRRLQAALQSQDTPVDVFMRAMARKFN